MVTVYIDEKPYQVEADQSMLDACLSLGMDLPYFCWHPAMKSVGACRQCAVKQFRDENDKKGKIVMACMTPAAEGTRISIKDPEAGEFRARVIEWLMLNHPHDCPVCDEGGECHLQDMTVMTGHNYRRSRYKKRTYKNQYLGPFVNHEMNRCIQCYRCVRFYNDYAGGRDFGVFAAHDHVYFGRHEDGVLESEFSGNLVEVCPTGVFTDRVLKKHYTRKWDLQTAPSICVHCSLGCNIIAGERYGRLRRVINRYNSEVNGYFICDRGRYGFEFVNSDTRLREPFTIPRPGNKQIKILEEGEALPHLKTVLARAKGIIGIGSPRASLEANYLLHKLAGPENFYAGFSGMESSLVQEIISIISKGPVRVSSLREAAMADCVLVLGEDVPNTAPMLGLALRQSVMQKPMEKVINELKIPKWNDQAVREAIQEQRGPLFIAAPTGGRLDGIAASAIHAAPDDIARLGFQVARILSPHAPPVEGAITEDAAHFAERAAKELKEAKRPLIISGAGAGSLAVLQAAANIAWALWEENRETALFLVAPECNSIGLGLMGGRSLDNAVKAVKDGKADTVIILENDIFDRLDFPEAEALVRARHVLAMDHLPTHTTSRADTVLPVSAFAEGGGTLINSEGRAQRFFKVYVPSERIEESWRWLRDLLVDLGRPGSEALFSLDEVTAAMAREFPVLKKAAEAAPPADFRIEGMKVPRQPHRYSGRTANKADVNVHEPKPYEDTDSPLSFSMEGYEGRPPSPLIPRFWAPGWNSVQSLNKFQSEVGGPLKGGPPGIRLIEPVDAKKGEISFFKDLPGPFAPRKNDFFDFFIVPLFHIFGSERLSAMSPSIGELVPAPYIALNPMDAETKKLPEGAEARLEFAAASFRLPVKLDPSLPRGVAGFPIGLPGLHGVVLPAWGRIALPGAENKTYENRDAGA